MKHAARLVFRVLSNLSLLLFIVAIAFWIRGLWRIDVVASGWTSLGWQFTVLSGAQDYVLALSPAEENYTVHKSVPVSPVRAGFPRLAGAIWVSLPVGTTGQMYGWPWLNVSYGHSHHRLAYAYLYVPAWLLTALLAGLPALRLARWRRARSRYGEGVCAHCGYDLRATPDHCPECGLKINALQALTPTGPSPRGSVGLR